VVSLFDGAGCEDDPASWLPPITLRVVGIGLTPGAIAPSSGGFLSIVQVTPAFIATAPRTAGIAGVAVRLHADADAVMLEDDLAGIGALAALDAGLSDSGEAVARGIRPVAIALAVAVALVALAGAFILAPLLVHQSDADAVDRPTLAALGMSSREQFMSAMLPATFVATVATVTAGIIAVAASPLTPIGLAQTIEPDPGVSVDLVVVGVGIAATALYVMTIAALTAWRRSRKPSVETATTPRRSSSVASHVASAGSPPTIVAGVHMAFNRGRGAAPVRTSIATIVVAIFTIAGSLTFGAGLTHLLDTPRLVGLNWDLFLGDPAAINQREVESALTQHPQVESFAAGTVFSPIPDGLQLGPQRLSVTIMGFDEAGGLGPSIIRGRAPAAPDEILVGAETLDELDLALGDTVDVFGRAGTWEHPGEETSISARIVGIGVVPIPTGVSGLGQGATMTVDGLVRLNPGFAAHGYWLKLRENSDARTVLDELLDDLGAVPSEDAFLDSSSFGEVVDTDQLEQVHRAPDVLAVVMALIAVGVIVHVLASALRANRKDLAVLRALGFGRGDVGRAAVWQSTLYTLVALAFAIPLGVLAGRVAWYLHAQRLGAVPETIVPWPALGLLTVTTLAFAAMVGWVLGRRTASLRPAEALRAE
jgi:hypothetical protein